MQNESKLESQIANIITKNAKGKSNITIHICSVCSKIFQNKHKAFVHLRVHTNDRPFKCDLCENAYKSKKSLHEHLLFHSGVKPHICNICQKTFRTRSNLTKHLQSHLSEKPYQCSGCKRVFKTKETIRVHIKKKVCQTIKCWFCPHRTSSEEERNEHLKNVHFSDAEGNPI